MNFFLLIYKSSNSNELLFRRDLLMNQNDMYKQQIKNNLEKINNKDVINNYLLLNYLIENKMHNKVMEYGVVPYKIDIEPISRCFLHCKYCQVPDWNRKNLPDMTFEMFKKIIDGLPSVIELKLQGQGEPLLNKELFNMIKYATNKHILVRFNTNGMLLNEVAVAEIINSGVFEVRLSLDGATAETNETMRAGLDFKKVINNVKKLVELRGNNTKPLINVWSLLNNDNYHELVELVELCNDIGVDGLKIQTKLSTRNDKEIEKKVLSDTIDLSDDELLNIMKCAEKRANELNLDLEIIKNKWRSCENHCWWLWNSVYISSDGYIVPCSILNNPELINFGNLVNMSFEEIWKSDQYNEFRANTLNMNIDSLCKWCYSAAHNYK